MAIPTKMADLFLVAASNVPFGGDAIGNNLDDYLRAGFSIVKSIQSVSTSTLVSAATTDLASSDAVQVTVSGTTTITSLGTGFAGCYREVLFSGALTLTHSAALILPGALPITTVANDIYCFRCLSAGNWIMTAGSRASATLASPAFTGVATYGGLEIGFRGLPQTVSNAIYTFVVGDKGKCRVKNNTTAYAYTVPSATFAAGDVVAVLNTGSAGAVTITQGASMVLQLTGTTTVGNRTLAAGGFCTILFDTAGHAFVSGPGLS